MCSAGATGVLGLGIDAGGTQTRWALADATGHIVAEGETPGLSALQMSSAPGRETVRANFAVLSDAVLRHGQPRQVRAGLTGFGGDGELLQRWLAELLSLDTVAITLCNDIEIAYLDSFKPGEGYLVYAGTGSIGAYLDADQAFHRAGGRGVLLDDGGGGFWIAREALRTIWRNEDERPGAWQQSPMARAVFDYVGGDDWAFSRQFIYGQEAGAGRGRHCRHRSRCPRHFGKRRRGTGQIGPRPDRPVWIAPGRAGRPCLRLAPRHPRGDARRFA